MLSSFLAIVAAVRVYGNCEKDRERLRKKVIKNVRANIIEKENYKIVGGAVAHIYCSNQMEGQT